MFRGGIATVFGSVAMHTITAVGTTDDPLLGPYTSLPGAVLPLGQTDALREIVGGFPGHVPMASIPPILLPLATPIQSLRRPSNDSAADASNRRSLETLQLPRISAFISPPTSSFGLPIAAAVDHTVADLANILNGQPFPSPAAADGSPAFGAISAHASTALPGLTGGAPIKSTIGALISAGDFQPATFEQLVGDASHAGQLTGGDPGGTEAPVTSGGPLQSVALAMNPFNGNSPLIHAAIEAIRSLVDAPVQLLSEATQMSTQAMNSMGQVAINGPPPILWSPGNILTTKSAELSQTPTDGRASFWRQIREGSREVVGNPAPMWETREQFVSSMINAGMPAVLANGIASVVIPVGLASTQTSGELARMSEILADQPAVTLPGMIAAMADGVRPFVEGLAPNPFNTAVNNAYGVLTDSLDSASRNAEVTRGAAGVMTTSVLQTINEAAKASVPFPVV